MFICFQKFLRVFFSSPAAHVQQQSIGSNNSHNLDKPLCQTWSRSVGLIVFIVIINPQTLLSFRIVDVSNICQFRAYDV